MKLLNLSAVSMNDDLKTATAFFDMLYNKGVKIEYTYDNGPGFLVKDFLGYNTIEFCFYTDGSYWRIMGTNENGFYSDEIHKDGWKLNE